MYDVFLDINQIRVYHESKAQALSPTDLKAFLELGLLRVTKREFKTLLKVDNAFVNAFNKEVSDIMERQNLKNG